jgi:hypothetical protein
MEKNSSVRYGERSMHILKMIRLHVIRDDISFNSHRNQAENIVSTHTEHNGKSSGRLNRISGKSRCCTLMSDEYTITLISINGICRDMYAHNLWTLNIRRTEVIPEHSRKSLDNWKISVGLSNRSRNSPSKRTPPPGPSRRTLGAKPLYQAPTPSSLAILINAG